MNTNAIFQDPWPVRHFDQLASTNELAGQVANEGDLGPCWLHASQQTKGRGRLGRNWASPLGNLYATALFPFTGPVKDAPLVCFLAGLALTDAIIALQPDLAGVVKLKWPNDVLAKDRKLAGILVELGAHQGVSWLAVGIGVNLAVAPENAGQPAIALGELAKERDLNPTSFLARLDNALRNRISHFLDHGFSAARQDWLARTAHAGRTLSFTLNGHTETGEFLDLGEDGALVIRDPTGKPHHVRAGDVGLIG